MIDLNSGSGATLAPPTLCDEINEIIDAEEEAAPTPPAPVAPPAA